MLVLSRKVGERIVIDDNVTVVINRIVGNRVSVGIEAPTDVRIVRGELVPVVNAFDQDASASSASNPVGPTFELSAAPAVHRSR